MSEFDKIAMKETRAFAQFQSDDEYVVAMVEDLSDWLNYLYKLHGDNLLTAENFFKHLNNGVILCKHAVVVQSLAEAYLTSHVIKNRKLPMKIGNQTLHVPEQPPKYTVVDFTKISCRFHARDNVSNFILWCRNFNIPQSLTFETDDLVELKNPRIVIIALLEVSRIGSLFGMEVPDIIQMDQEIEDEINRYNFDADEIKFPATDENFMTKPSEIDSVDFSDNNENPEANIIKNRIEKVDGCIQKNNSSLNGNRLMQSRFGFKSRRASLNLPHNDSANQVQDQIAYSYENNFDIKTTVLNDKEVGDINRVDNSDSESNFSQNSHSKFVMPKYKKLRPVGRVKIYDNFDQSNYVKEKKTREKVDLRSLDERVRDILSQCKCSDLFLMKRIGEGRYQWGDKKTMIFIRILRTHVMVRVGGGWSTLGEFLYKHDPCRKEKCDHFKFCLPAQNKRPRSMSIDNELLLQSAEPFSRNMLPKSQTMIVDRGMFKKCSFEANDGNETLMLKEEVTESDTSIKKENFDESVKNLNSNERPEIQFTETVNNNESNESFDELLRVKSPKSVVNNERRYSSLPFSQNPKRLITFNQRTISCVSDNNNPSTNKDDIRKTSSRIPRLKS